MILSFIEIDDFKTSDTPFNEGNTAIIPEITDREERISTGQYTELPADNPSDNTVKVEDDSVKNSTSKFKGTNYSSQFFGDTFELRYLEHKEKVEKERFVRELLAGDE